MCSAFLRIKEKWFCKDKILLAAPPCRSCVGLTKSSTGSSSLLALCPDLLHPTLFLLLVQTNNSQNTNTSEFFVPRKAQYVAVCKILAPQTVFNMNTVDSLDTLSYIRSLPDTPCTYPVLPYLQSAIYTVTIHCNALHYIYAPLYYICINLRYAA